MAMERIDLSTKLVRVSSEGDNTWNGKAKPFQTLARERGMKLARKAKRWMDGFPNAVHGDRSAGKQEREE